jgi:hypothetical protein
MKDLLNIHEISVLTPEYCEKALSSVLRLKSYWIPYEGTPEKPHLFTLGAASYRHPGNPTSYLDRIQQVNPILKDEFGWLYDFLKSSLQQQFQHDFCFDEAIGLPGFHIFSQSLPKGGSIHFDFQQMNVPWNNRDELDFDQILSMTLAIQMPPGSQGLNYWPLFDQLRRQKLPPEARKPLGEVEKGLKAQITYRTGFLYAFKSQLLHQISPFLVQADGEERVTLQAHAIWNRKGYWILYW